jgi:nitronate monooxygenase
MKCAELEAKQAELQEILQVVGGAKAKLMYEQGDLDAGIVSCGQGVGMASDIPSIQELFDRIVSEASDIAGKLAGS